MHNKRIAATFAGVFCANVGLFFARFFLFERTESTGMFADALHAASDAGGNLWLLAFLYFSTRPPDMEHPTGHSFRERFAVIGIGILICSAAIFGTYEAIGRLLSGRYPHFSIPSLLFFSATIIISGAISWYEHRSGHRFHSKSLLADALHTLADVGASIAVLIGYSFVAIGIPYFDPAAAFIVFTIIAGMGIYLIWENRKPHHRT